ncbi:head maturation protease, ClpP-related [Promicromonospora sp. NPDC023805]|uniref:head maturation protease, ClpP-related n=1 Tax=Promicromonospora sp. NPDC023805 TaxID=3154696 RepID=UPI0033EE4095
MPARLVTDVWQHLRARDERSRPASAARIRVVANAETDTTRIDLMDEIGFWGTTAQDFVDELLAIDASVIELHVNSPGGDVFDGLAIMNALADHPATVNVVVDGLAASAASFIAMAGDNVKMNRGSQLMIHDAIGFSYGNAADMEEMATLLSRISDTIAGIYADRAGGKADDWRDLMRAETWYSASEAADAGLADEAVSGPKDPPDPDEGDEGDDPPAEPVEPAEPGEDDPPAEPADEDADVDEDDDVAPAARFAAAFSRFVYAGRAQAPAPPTPGKQPGFQFDPDAFRAAIKEGMTS